MVRRRQGNPNGKGSRGERRSPDWYDSHSWLSAREGRRDAHPTGEVMSLHSQPNVTRCHSERSEESPCIMILLWLTGVILRDWVGLAAYMPCVKGNSTAAASQQVAVGMDF